MRLLSLLVWAALACQGALNVPLTLTDRSGVARASEPITSGVPVPRAENITDVAALMVTDAFGNIVPAQMTVLARWGGPPEDAAKPIKWVLLDFAANLGAQQSAIYYLRDRNAPDPPSPQVTVQEEGGRVTVSTGALTFTIRHDSFSFLDSVTLGGVPLVAPSPAAGLSVVEGGSEYASTQADPSYSVVVEQRGPQRAQLRITGDLISREGERKCKYIIRLIAYAGSTSIKAYTTVVFDQDMETFKPSQITLTLPLQLSGGLLYTIGGEDGEIRGSLGAADSVNLLQNDHSAYSVTRNGSPVVSGRRSRGWLDLSDGTRGVTVWIRDLWQNHPLELEAEGNLLRVHLWPRHGNYTEQVDRNVALAKDNMKIGHFFPYWPGSLMDLRARSVARSGVQDPPKCNPEYQFFCTNAFGISKTWEINYFFHPGDGAPAADFVRRAEDRLLLTNPSWFCASGALGKLLPQDAARFPQVETLLNSAFDRMSAAQESHKDYGFADYGDAHYDYTPSGYGGRYWLSHRLNWQQSVWTQYIRTGDPKYLRYARAANLHAMDIDVQQLTGSFTDARGNRVRKYSGAISFTHGMGNSHWGGYSSVHAGEPFMDVFIEPLLTQYYLTGYDRAMETARLRGERLLESGTRGALGARSVTGALHSPSKLYEATGDPRYLAYATTMFQRTASELARADGMLYTESGGAATNWSVFGTSWSHYSLLDYYQASGDPAARELAAKVAKAIGAMGLTAQTSGTRQYYFPFRAYATCFELTQEAACLQHGKRFLDVTVGFTNLLVSPSRNLTNETLAQILYQAPYLLFHLANYQGTLEPPRLAPAYFRIPVDGGDTRITYVTQDSTDAAFTFKFMFESGVDFFGAWPPSSPLTLRVVAPGGAEVLSDTFELPGTQGEIFAGNIDNRIRTYTVPSDGRTGDYRIEIFGATPRPGEATIPVGTLVHSDNPISLLVSANAIATRLDRGIYWFYVPPGTPSFTAVSPVNVTLMNSAGQFVTANATVPTASAGSFWAIITRADNDNGGLYPLSISGVPPLLSSSPSIHLPSYAGYAPIANVVCTACVRITVRFSGQQASKGKAERSKTDAAGVVKSNQPGQRR